MAGKLPPPELTVTGQQARRFLLAHHRLLPPRGLRGTQGVLDYMRHVNCVQYDPINVVGQNSHLVMQARVRGYKPAMLDALLYEERKLIDGFDKQMSIYPVEDWPDFAYQRAHIGANYVRDESTATAGRLAEWVKREIETRGPLSSLDLEEDTRVDWWLSGSTRAVRIALDMLFLSGDIVVHHRTGTRRYFDLAQRALPRRLSRLRAPHSSQQEYLEWHVFRRSGGVGLVHPRVNAKWGGIAGWRGGQIRAALSRLLANGRLMRVAIEGLPRKEFYIRRGDLASMEAAASGTNTTPSAAFIAPLDNVMWDGELIEMLFDYFYTWEVYKPVAKRTWGYYVLPVLIGDRFVARFDPGFDRRAKAFTIQNWWWERDVDKNDEAVLAALQDCVRQFCTYLGADTLKLGEKPKRDSVLRELTRAV